MARARARARVVAVLLAVVSLVATMSWELTGGPSLFSKSDPVHLLTLPVGLAIAGLHEFAYRTVPVGARLRRVRITVYLWQATAALADLIIALDFSFGRNQSWPDLPLFPGAVQALHCLYLAMTFDLIVLRPAELWTGSGKAASTGRTIRRFRVHR